MAWTPTDNRLGIQPIGSTSTVQNHTLGTIVRAEDSTYGSGEFIYLLGIVNTLLGSLCDFDPYLKTTAIAPATGGIGPCAVSMSANGAGGYGWYQIGGAAVVKAPNGMTVGADVFMLAATAGSVDDAAVNGEQILNAKVSTTTGTPGTGFAVITIDRPFHQGQTV